MKAINDDTIWLFYVLIPLIGITVSGVNGLVAGAVAADLGYTSELQGNDAAIASVTGIVDGTGSLGSAVGMILIG